MFWIAKMGHDEYRTDEHRNDCCDGGSFDTHIEPENKNRIEDYIKNNSDQDGIHRFLRVACCPHDTAETVTEVDENTTRNHD